MNTSDQNKEQTQLERLQKELQEQQINCAIKTLGTMQTEVEHLRTIESVIFREDVMIDMLVMQLHNIISIVPEEQYRFLEPLQKIFNALPVEIIGQPKVKYIIDRLGMMKEEDLNSKAFQPTDLSQYWSSYRTIVYTQGVEENRLQAKQQKELLKQMQKVVRDVLDKRLQGIETANILIKNAGA